MAPAPSSIRCELLPNVPVRNISCSEAASLIEVLKQAQTNMATGKQLHFELLSGGLASGPMTKVTPREAFMKISFEKALSIDRVKTQNKLWQPYKLSYATGSHGYGPSGLVEFYWDIEVVLGFTGGIQRVHMASKPPSPH